MKIRSLPWPAHRQPSAASEPSPAGQAAGYKAFISYSHAVDGKLAPALHGALHRFAKPWYRPRALRVFHDQASLAANPGLWSSIQTALADSEFFVLLASPEAAQSAWVAREADYWVRHKPLSNFLIVLTDGELVWDPAGGDFDWTKTTALPRSLQGVFQDEPRYIDLKWARSEEQLSLAHPRFRECVAELAAPLHGQPKDELVGEDVRQHRRTVRLVRTVVASLTVLALLATTLALVARDQRDDARLERNRAISRQLAAQAPSQQLDRWLLLSLQASRISDTEEARSALLSGLQHRGRVKIFLHPDGAATSGARPSQDARPSQPLEEPRSLASSATFSPDGTRLAFVTGNNTVTVWDVPSGRRLHTLGGHQSRVQAVAFARDGKTLSSASSDRSVALWDVATGRRLGEPLKPPKEGKEATTMTLSPDGKLLAAATDKKIALWALGSDQPPRILDGHGGAVTSLAFNRDGTTLASGGEDKVVVLWDARSGGRPKRPLSGHPDSVTSVAFSPAGTTLAAGSDDSTITLWDVGSRRRLGSPLVGHNATVRSLAFSPDGATLASGGGDRMSVLWDVASRQRLDEPLTGLSASVTSVAFSRDGATLASALSDGTVILWDPRSHLRPGEPMSGHSASVSSVAFNRKGTALASASNDGTVVLWDSRSGRRLRTLTGQGRLLSVAFSPNGTTLAAGSRNGTIFLWDVRSGRRQGRPLTGHQAAVTSVAFSPDGTTLASGSRDETAVLWDPRSGQPRLKPLPGQGRLLSVAFSPDGTTLAAGGRGGMVILWDPRNGRRRGEPLPGQGRLLSVAFSPDGTTLAAGSDEGTIALWDVHSRRRLPALTGHSASVTSVAFSPDGTTLASGSEDRTIALWDLAGRRRLASLAGHTASVTSVAFSRDGGRLASGIHDRTVAVWEGDVSVDSWQRRACHLANRNLTQAEWAQYIGRDLPFQDTCPQPPSDKQQTAPAPSPASATQPTTTSHNPKTNTRATPSAVFPNPTERQLLQHVPPVMRAGCDRAPEPLTSAIAAVRCTDQRVWVQYNLFRSTGLMNRLFSSRAKAADAHVGSCRRTSTRPHVDKVLRDRQQIGRILCYERRGEARLEWTHEPLRIYAFAFSTRLTTHSLYHDIFEHAGPLS